LGATILLYCQSCFVRTGRHIKHQVLSIGTSSARQSDFLWQISHYYHETSRPIAPLQTWAQQRLVFLHYTCNYSSTIPHMRNAYKSNNG